MTTHGPSVPVRELLEENMNALVLVTVVVAALAAAPSWADWEYTRWGMTPEQVAAASGGAVTVEPPEKRQVIAEVHRRSGANGTYSGDGLQLDLRFQFDSNTDGLVCVFATVADAAQNERYRSRMFEKYGPPQKKQGLAVIGEETFLWNQSDDMRLQTQKGQKTVLRHCKTGFGF